jgi:hypothetical protein
VTWGQISVILATRSDVTFHRGAKNNPPGSSVASALLSEAGGVLWERLGGDGLAWELASYLCFILPIASRYTITNQ